MDAIPTSGPLSYGFRRSATHTHQGVDLVAKEGTPVYALEPGTVTHASAELAKGFSGYGGHVVYQSGSDYWLLGHLSSIAVAPGDQVIAGAELGRVGRTCYSEADPLALCEGAHLHLELSSSSYPKPSEAPRIDPVPRLRELGGLGALFGLFSVPGNPAPSSTPASSPASMPQSRSSGVLWFAGVVAGGGLAALLWWRRGR